MEENKKQTTLTQKDYQKKYDKKTKTILAKYVLSEMDDYNRLKKYLDETGQSTNSFIKELIKDFFAKGHNFYGLNPKKEYEKMEFFKYAEISDESLQKLKSILSNDEEKYNIVLDLYAEYTKDEIEQAQLDKACEFENWVEDLENFIEEGEVDLKSNEQFKKDIGHSISDNLHPIFCA